MTTWYQRPVWAVADVNRSLDFFVRGLGFREDWRFEEGEPVRIVQVSRDGCEIILSTQWPDRIGHGLAFISLDDGAAVDALQAELASRGISGTTGHWGYRTFILRDPDGNQLYFPYPADAPAIG